MNDVSRPAKSPPSLTDRLMKGTAWTVGMRWGIRLLGMLSMIVLARLLEPEDFGLHAMTMAVIALVDVLTDLGVAAALIRDKHAGRAQLDTAWTLRQAQLLLVAAVVILCSPLAAKYYDDPRVTSVLQVVAIAFAVRGFENIGVINFRRELMFHRDFAFEVAVKLGTVIVTIGLALWLRNYWALALGVVSGAALRVALSYWMSPYRPRWSLEAWRELWAFSQWVLSQGVARYIYERVDVLVLGRLSSPGPIGYYTVANEVAQMPAQGIALPVSRVVFPGLAQIVDEPMRLRTAYLNALNAVAAVALPIAFGILAVAPELIAVALGEQWLPAVGLLQVFSALSAFWALTSLSANLLIVLGHIRYITLITWVQAVLLIGAIVPTFQVADLMGVAALRAALALIGFVLVLHFVVRTDTARWEQLAVALLRPVLASAAMLGAVYAVDTALDPGRDALTALALKVPAGAIAYCAVLLGTWHLSGRPEGLESVLIGKLRRRRAQALGA